MLRTITLLFIGLIISQLPLLAQPEQGPQPPIADSTDILSLVLQKQQDMPAPPTEFRPGAVTPRLIRDLMELNNNGFEIQLPSRGMAPSPTIYDGIAYVSGGFGSRQFYAFDAQTGRTRWAIDLSDDGPSSGVVVDGILVFNTESCTIFALESSSGEMKWAHYLGDPLMSTPTVANGKVFTAYPAEKHGAFYPSQQQTPNASPTIQDMNLVGAEAPADKPLQLNPFTHILVAFDLFTGEILWQKWIDGDVMSAPVAEDGELYVATFPGTVFRFDQRTGEILAANARQATSAPVLANDQLLLTMRADTGSQVREQVNIMDRGAAAIQTRGYTRSAPYLDPKVQQQSAYAEEAQHADAGNGFGGGAPATSGWQAASLNVGQSNVSSLQAYQGSRILAIGKRHYATMGNEIICTNASNGEMLWKRPLSGDLEDAGGHLATPPIKVGDNILVCTLAGEILLFKAKNGKLLYQHSIGEQVRSQPVVDQGRIYLTTMSGKFLSLDTGDASLTGWPTWGGNAAHTNRGEE